MRLAMRSGSTSTHSATPSFIVIASGWAPPIPPEPGGDRDRAGERAAEPAPGDLGEALVGALQDPLGADVDPRAGGHLAVHREPERLEAAELRPVRPVGDEVGVGDEHTRRPLVGAEHADRLARLDEQRLVVGERRAASSRWRRRRPTIGRRAPCRRTRRGCRGPRRPLDRGCSSASAAPPRSASCGTTTCCPAGRAPDVGRRSSRRPARAGADERTDRRLHGVDEAVRTSRAVRRRPARATASGPGRHRGRRRRAGRRPPLRCPLPAVAGRAARGHGLRTRARRRGSRPRLATARRSLRAAPHPIDT